MNTTIRHFFGVPVLLAAASIALAPSGAQAQEESGEYDWKISIGGTYVTPLSDSDIDFETVEASSEFGYELGIEWKFSDRIGIEATYLDTDLDVEAGGDKIAEVGFNPWLFTLNFHVIDRNAFNWYVGPTVTYVDWGNLEGVGGGSASVDSDSGIGVSTGIAIGLGQSLAIQFGLRYLDVSAESSGDDVSVDPLLTNIGIAFRF